MRVMMTVEMVLLLGVNSAAGDYHSNQQFHPLLAALRT